MKRIPAITSVVLLASCLYLSACKNKKETASVSKSAPSYTADIKAILDESCAKTCHSAEKHRHNIDLSTYESTKAAAGRKNFLGSIRHEAGYKAMPLKAEKLPDHAIEKIAAWVNGGMPQ